MITRINNFYNFNFGTNEMILMLFLEYLCKDTKVIPSKP